LPLISFLAPLAIVTSIATLVLLVAMGDVGRRGAVMFAAWLLAAGYAQFFGPSMAVSVVGLGFQTLLAIYLIVRWRLAA
jgi:hypothetical protein